MCFDLSKFRGQGHFSNILGDKSWNDLVWSDFVLKVKVPHCTYSIYIRHWKSWNVHCQHLNVEKKNSKCVYLQILALKLNSAFLFPSELHQQPVLYIYYLSIIILYSFNEFLEVVYLPKMFKANLTNNCMYNKHSVVLNFLPDLNLLFLCFWLW